MFRLPSEVQDWTQAMMAEADEPRGVVARVSWRLGVVTTTCRLLIAHAVRRTLATRTLAATCTSAYFGAFSVFVAGRLALEVVTDHVPPLWGHPWLSIARCLSLVIVSFVATMALWHRRRIGRPMAIGFAGILLATGFPSVSVLPDALIIAALAR